MADELNVDASLSVERLLERKDHEHPVHVRLHRLHAAGAPRPQLRADVVDDGDAETAERGQQPEIEVRRVDGHEHVRTQLTCLVDEPPQHRERARHDADRFGQAGDRQAAVVADEMPARGFETMAAEAEDFGVRLARMQLRGERAGIQIARRLAAGDHDSHRRSRRAMDGVDRPG